jgi:hypothetical protein
VARTIAVICAVLAGFVGGCAVATTSPPAPRPFGETAFQEPGVIVAVRDTTIDLRTGVARGISAHTPAIPMGPVAMSVPVTVGGERRRQIPGEELTIRLVDGRLIFVVQERNDPPFAVTERVRVLHERPNEVTGESRTKVVRAD